MRIRQLPKPAFSLVVAGASGGIMCKMPSGFSLETDLLLSVLLLSATVTIFPYG